MAEDFTIAELKAVEQSPISRDADVFQVTPRIEFGQV